jgi:putative transposase
VGDRLPIPLTVDGKAIKIASMIDEHTRVSLLHIVERSITARAACRRAQEGVRRGLRPAEMLRMDHGPEFISQALQRFCDGKTGMFYIPPGTPWNNGHIESFNNRLRKECLNRNHWNTLFEARVVIGDFSMSTTTVIAAQRWATAHRPSTPRPAGAPTPQ